MKKRSSSDCYTENIEEDEDAHAGNSPDGTDEDRCKVIPQIRFAHPLHDMEEVQDHEEDQSDNRVYNEYRELFGQVVYDNNDGRHKKDRNKNRTQCLPLVLFTNDSLFIYFYRR